jgi:hypothetical protein
MGFMISELRDGGENNINFYSLERERTFIVRSEKEVVVLSAAGIELQSCCKDCYLYLQ